MRHSADNRIILRICADDRICRSRSSSCIVVVDQTKRGGKNPLVPLPMNLTFRQEMEDVIFAFLFSWGEVRYLKGSEKQLIFLLQAHLCLGAALLLPHVPCSRVTAIPTLVRMRRLRTSDRINTKKRSRAQGSTFHVNSTESAPQHATLVASGSCSLWCMWRVGSEFLDFLRVGWR